MVKATKFTAGSFRLKYVTMDTLLLLDKFKDKSESFCLIFVV